MAVQMQNAKWVVYNTTTYIVANLPKPKVVEKSGICGSKEGHFHIKAIHFHIIIANVTTIEILKSLERQPSEIGTVGTYVHLPIWMQFYLQNSNSESILGSC